MLLYIEKHAKNIPECLFFSTAWIGKKEKSITFSIPLKIKLFCLKINSNINHFVNKVLFNTFLLYFIHLQIDKIIKMTMIKIKMQLIKIINFVHNVLTLAFPLLFSPHKIFKTFSHQFCVHCDSVMIRQVIKCIIVFSGMVSGGEGSFILEKYD